MSRINPFQPNSPVNPGMFVGRLREVERLRSALIQASAGMPTHFMITGERGIGKSSLLMYLTYVAKGLIPVEGTTLRFLVVDTDVDRNTTQLGLIRKIELSLRNELGKSEPARDFLASTWGFIKRFEGGGFKLGEESGEKLDEVVLDEFAYSLANTAQRICDDSAAASVFSAKYDGVLLLIDEADNASDALDLGTFTKLLLERLQRRGCARLILGLAGLSNLRNALLASHPSALRAFEELPLDRLSDDEVQQVISACLDQANKVNAQQTGITADARANLALFAEGYPHFIQQFGYSAFAADQDGTIDGADVGRGALGKRGALELVGERYYRNDFYNKIQKESYRQVLRIMADKLDGWISKQDIRAKYRGNDSTFDNAIQALRDRKIILSKEGERGVYRLQHKGFALWIKFYTTDPERLKQVLLQETANVDVAEQRGAGSGD